MSDEIDLGLGVLDHQLLDVDVRRCGKVDDLELERLTSGELRVAAVLCGPGAWRGRGRVGALVARLTGGRVVKIAWEDVESLDSAVRLRRRARELGLADGDERARRWVARVPGAGR
jgi:hypothetical protein